MRTAETLNFSNGLFLFAHPVDDSQLQADLDKLVLWAQKWQMVFNVDKCKVMRVGNWEDRRTYYMEERELSVVSCEKDLGVWISADMKSSKQSM